MISSPYYQGRQVSTENLSRCMIVIDIVLVMVNGMMVLMSRTIMADKNDGVDDGADIMADKNEHLIVS